MQHLLYILLLLFAPDLFAGPFDPPPTDESVSLLGIIFGANVGDIYLGGTANPVLSSLMEQFNFVIVVAGTCIVSYVAILSTINTAHEGTAMGKRWSAVWVPMRSVAGMALMIPAPASGYSMIQVTVMWIILQGIGAADSLWNIALNGLASGASATTGTVSTPGLATAGFALAQQVLDAQICMDALYQAASTKENVAAQDWVNVNGQYVQNFAQALPQYAQGAVVTGTAPNRVATMSGYSYFGVNNGNQNDMQICGKLLVTGTVTESVDFPEQTIPGQSTTVQSFSPTPSDLQQQAENIYNAKLNAISSMLTVSQALSQGIVNGTYVQPQSTGSTSTNTPPAGYAVQMVNAYTGAMQALIVPNSVAPATTTPGASVTDNSAIVQATIQAGEQNGWVSAGSFYFVFNRTLQSTLFQSAQSGHDSITDPDSTNVIPDCSSQPCQNSAYNLQGFDSNSASYLSLFSKGIQSTTDLNNMAYYLAQGSVYLTNDNKNCSANASGNCQQAASSQLNLPAGAGASNQATQALGIMTNGASNIISLMSSLLNNAGQGDPLLAHAIFGRNVMNIIEDIFIALFAIIVALWVLAPLPFVGAAFSAAAQGILGLVAIIMPFLGIAWAFGAVLAIYCPLIPYMIFTMGVIGWMMTVVEAIIAAPLIALGLVLPEGDELAKIHGALMILANIFLRPMLMVFGFLLAANVYKAAITLVDFGMAAVFSTINVSTLFSWIVVMAVYVSFILSITNICFSLIYAIPDKILRWLGGSPESTQAGNLDEVKGKAQGISSQAGEGLGGIGEKAGSKGAGLAKTGLQGNMNAWGNEYKVAGGQIGRMGGGAVGRAGGAIGGLLNRARNFWGGGGE